MRERILRSVFGLLLILVVAIPAPASASSPVLDRVVKSGELRVGMSGNQPPLNAKNRSGELTGLEVDLARLLATAMGVEAKLVVKPFPELLPALKAGEIDVVMSGMTITPARTLQAAFVGPYIVSGQSILTKSKTLAAADEAGANNKGDLTLAALAESTSQRFVEVVLPKAKLVKTQDYDSAVKMVVDDEVDALVADMPICLLSVLRYPDQGLATLVTPLTVEPIGIALPADDPLLLNLVENYLCALERTGLLDRLQVKWLEDGSWVAALP